MRIETELIPKKDRLALWISLFSLLVSLATFASSQWDSYSAKTKKLAIAKHDAYRLGGNCALIGELYAVKVDDDKNIELKRNLENVLSPQFEFQMLGGIRPIAERLGLKVDVMKLLEVTSRNPSHGFPFINAVWRDLEVTHDTAVADMFLMGYRVGWLRFKSTLQESDFLTINKDEYAEMAEKVNLQLGESGIKKRFPETLKSAKETKKIADQVDLAMLRRLAVR